MNDIILSSRIRLARNIDGYPFFLKDERASLLAKTVADKLKKIGRFSFYHMSKFADTEALAMMERHLISQDLIKNKKFGAAVVSEDESISFMLNEEDHIREQCILSGLSLEQAYQKISLIDAALATELKFAFSPTFGYLTSCLTNLGTGMRASVMMFLPALTLTKSLERCLNSVTRFNMAVRGVYGEGSESSGFIYQISNQRSLGITEKDIYQSVESAANHIATAEIKAREYLIKSNPNEIKDKILRSYGVLTNCYMINHNEFLNHIAFIKLGAFYKMLSIIDYKGLNDFITDMGPANISIHLKDNSPLERDIRRAENCRKRLSKFILVKYD